MCAARHARHNPVFRSTQRFAVNTHPYSSSPPRALAVSPDGYIRIRLSNLDVLPFVHLFSESDDGFLQELQSQTIPARCAGFSEWISDTTPPISIGWGWFVHSDSERMLLAPDGVRSNVMLIDTQGYDLGPQKTASLFGAWLSAFEWQPAVSTALNHHASHC